MMLHIIYYLKIYLFILLLTFHYYVPFRNIDINLFNIKLG